MIMAPSAPRFAPPPQLDCFLHTTIRVERNGTELSVLSLLARAGKDPWTEAARLASLPRAAAADSLAATIACLPAGSLPASHARVVALCLVLLLPDQDHPALDTFADGRRRGSCLVIPLLTGAAFAAALAVWLLIVAAAWAISHTGALDASADAAGTSRPSVAEQPGDHRSDPERPARAHSAVSGSLSHLMCSAG